MSGLKRLVHEIHRRSLWQVLAIFLAASWGVLQFVDFLTERAGLPEWTPVMALVLLLIGLPIVLATAYVQEGGPSRIGVDTAEPIAAGEVGAGDSATFAVSTPDAGGESPGSAADAHAPLPPAPEPTGIQRWLTWRKAMLGGAGAFALLGVSIATYLVMWSAGIGPVGSLVAQGVLDEQEPILLAEFGNTTSDPTLGSVVTEALRVDLASSRVVSLVEISQVQDALRRMERDPGAALTPEIAREMALREGVKAVLEGEVGAAGTGYILTATLRATADGSTLASFRRTASGPDAVIGAIDQLSRDVRERVGEPLRSIRSGPPLGQVTTPSLEALRKYSQAEQVLARGDEMGALALLGEALALDSAFAMAHRKQAVVLRNLGIDRAREIEAVERAYRHRTRLPEKERYLAEAAYHSAVTGDKEALVRSYESVLEVAPDDPAALNNLANEYQSMGDLERAEGLYRRNLAGPWAPVPSHQNLIRNQLMQGNPDGAKAALSAYAHAHPEDPRVLEHAFWVHAFSGDHNAAFRELDALIDAPGLPAVRRANTLANRGLLLAAYGRMREARREWDSAIRLAEQAGPRPEQVNRMMALWMDAVVTGDTARVRASLQELVRSGRIEQAPVEASEYGFLVELYLTVNDPDGSLEKLDHWRRELSTAFTTPAIRANQVFLEAWARSGRSDPEAVLEALAVLRRDLRCPHCFEWERPQLLYRTGRIAEARDAWMQLLAHPISDFGASLALLPVALEEVGRLSEELGDRNTASDAYRRFIDLWADADPELQPRVTRARERLATLEAP
jgi:eukaryotic-like serine/threonine-protein kinase